MYAQEIQQEALLLRVLLIMNTQINLKLLVLVVIHLEKSMIDVKSFLEKNKNYDLTNYSSKNFEEFINNEIKMDHVITVCNNANNEVCPIWPDKNQIIHWDIEDPVTKLQNANDEEKQIIIRNTFNVISNKIKDWLDEK